MWQQPATQSEGLSDVFWHIPWANGGRRLNLNSSFGVYGAVRRGNKACGFITHVPNLEFSALTLTARQGGFLLPTSQILAADMLFL